MSLNRSIFGRNTMEIKVERIDKDIELPSFAHKHDAGLDLRAAEEVILKPMEKQVVRTGLKVAVPPGHAGLVWDRSGLAAHHAIHNMAGVVDAGYRGEIKVVMINLGKEEFKVERGMRIAQMVVHPVVNTRIIEVEALDETKRGDGGFGSTGI